MVYEELFTGIAIGFLLTIFGAWFIMEIMCLLKLRKENIERIEKVKMKEIALKVKSMIENQEV